MEENTFDKTTEDCDFAKQVEDSLRKKFKKKLFSRFTKAIVEYELIEPNEIGRAHV